MLTGLLFLLGAGIFWCIVGICYEQLPGEKRSTGACMFGAGILVNILQFIILRPPVVSMTEFWKVAMWLLPSGLCFFPILLFVKKAMMYGKAGGAWCIMQSAMFCPLLAMLIFYGERLSTLAVVGIALLIAGIVCWGIGKKEEENTDPQAVPKSRKKFILYSLLAFAMTGLQQTLTLIPSKIGNISPAAMEWRVIILQLPMFLWIVPCIKYREFPRKKHIRFSFWYAIAAVGGEILFFMGIDALNKIKLSGLAYPAALNCSIVLFALYCRFFRHQKFTPVELAGLVLTVTGIFFLL